MVLAELMTEWGCDTCKPANDELDRFAPLHNALAVIRYHTWWPSGDDPFYLQNQPENSARTNYYQPGSKFVPRFFVDGILDGGSGYPGWEGLVFASESSPSPLRLSMDGTYNPGSKSGTATVYVEVTGFIGLLDLRLHFVVTESGINLPAPNGQTVFNQVMRDMLPDADGEQVLITGPADSLIRTRNFTLGPSWVADNCEIVAFIQDEPTRIVLQAGKWKMYGSIHDVGTESIAGPPGQVTPGSLQYPSAWIENYGDFSESFPVFCTIMPGGYASAREATLGPGGSGQLFFDGWNVPLGDSVNYTMCVWTALEKDMEPSNDTLCKQILSANPSMHDAGVDSIPSPPGSVRPDSVYTPRAWVHNYGHFTEAFDVECAISPGGYVDTFGVASLGAGGDQQCVFRQWAVPPGDSVYYLVCVRALLPGDMNTANDTLCKVVHALSPAGHDVGVESISSPPDTVVPGSSHSPRAWVRNYGGYPESFPVECLIGPGGYSDTVTVNALTPGSSNECVFSQWTVPLQDSVSYTLRIKCLMAGDANTLNDTMSKGVYALYGDMHDVGVCGINSPPDTVQAGSVYSPSICVEDCGVFNETFWTFCSIDSSGQCVYIDSARVNSIRPGQQRQVNLAGWTVPYAPGMSFDVCAWVALASDQNPANDTLCKAVYALVGIEERVAVPGREGLVLRKSAPNPFSSFTRAEYETGVSGRATVSVFDVAGNLVTVLADGIVPAGRHCVVWDGRDRLGSPAREGVYFLMVRVGRLESTFKMVLVR